jgi:hypothetical protein
MTQERGYSFLELLFAVSLCATLGGIAVPPLLTALNHHRTAGAARYLGIRVQRARMEAISRSSNVALHFVQSAAGYSYATYVDGNGDGVRSADIASGVDPRVSAIERLADNFAGVQLGVLPNLPSVDPGGAPPAGDPIKLGTSNLLSYSPSGTSSSGSLYVRGPGQIQYVIRILGDTGRTRLLRFDPRLRQWVPR